MTRKHIYTRTHDAHAWKYEHTSNDAVAESAREVNKGFGVETLLVPDICPAFAWLDSCQTQSDFETTNKIDVGDFISVPAWETHGQVIEIGPAFYGSDNAQRVLLQEQPEAAGKWYTLEPDEFHLEYAKEEAV